MGYDAASHPRQTLPWVTMPYNIPEGFFSCVMMLHHIPEEFCPWLGCCIIQENSALGYDAASHPRQTLPWVTIPYNIAEGFYHGL